MEFLRLDYHDPEEYEGKLIEYNNCLYVIGRHIATGLEKIVHVLINKESGLFLNVVKIARNPEQTKNAYYLSEPPEKLAIFFQICLYSTIVEAYGGVLEIQQALVSIQERDPVNNTGHLMKKANNLIAQSNFNEALSVCNEILDINPYHTIALSDSGEINAQMGNFDVALQYLLKAVAIEPNDINIYTLLIRCSDTAGYLLIALKYFKKMKTVFPYFCDLDELAIDLYVQVGQPENAESFLEKAYLIDKDKHEELGRNIANEINAKRKALKMLPEVEKLLHPDNYPKILDLEILEDAYKNYNKDRFINMNLGLALKYCGRYDLAKETLRSLIGRVPLSLEIICIVNIAFCEIGLSNFAKAIHIFECAMEYLGYDKDSELHWADVPGATHWVILLEDEVVQIDKPEVAFKLISEAIENYSPDTAIPDSVKYLAKLYRQAASALRQK